MREEQLFLEALDLPAERRSDYLAKACAADEPLRGRVEALLRANDRAAGFLDPLVSPPSTPVANGASLLPPGGDLTGRRIGRYRLTGLLGEGGMGTVYSAEQVDPVKRTVAVKVIRAGMDSASFLNRFDAERQALALMDHPHIARILDGGVTEEGRPYFVMEWVAGRPLTEYCDAGRLSTAARLELFETVCGAVQHAHQKGIIHRDLKPSNILVETRDGKPCPKVIDFGIAKALRGSLTDKSMHTEAGFVVGTREYMSPEMADLSSGDIDTRSDVYSLGVILYELLTGRTPFEPARLRQSSMLECLRIIREEEPPAPSSRLKEADTLVDIADRRDTEPERLIRQLRGELDWIAAKALEKDRSRRYESPSALAEDLRRYRNNEPILAGPPSRVYRLRKFVRRNRPAVLAGGVALAALIAGATAATIGLVQARDSNKLAEKRFIDLQAEKTKADEAKTAALEERDAADGVARFLTRDLLAQASAEGRFPAGLEPNPDIKLRTVLDNAVRANEGRFDKHPRTEAKLRQTIGRTYSYLGDFTKAEPHLKRALELAAALYPAADPDLVDIRKDLATVHVVAGRYEQAFALLDANVDALTAAKGPNHADTLAATLQYLYYRHKRMDSAEELRRTEEVRDRIVEHLEPRHPLLYRADMNLARALAATGAFARAEELIRRNLAERDYAPANPNALAVVYELARTMEMQRKTREAEACYRDLLSRAKFVNGEDSPYALIAMSHLARIAVERKDWPVAEPLCREVYEAHRRVYGAGHNLTFEARNNLAMTFEGRRMHDKAESLWREGCESIRPVRMQVPLANLHAGYSNLLYNLFRQAKHAQAEPVLREYLEILEKRKTADFMTHYAKSQMGDALTVLGKREEAEKYLLEAEKGLAATRNEVPPTAQRVRMNDNYKRLVALYEGWGKPEMAAPWKEKWQANQVKK